MTKTVVTKMSPLPNVVGRVDYISNPKRQENLLAVYQTPAAPEQFWQDLSEVSRARSEYHPGSKVCEAREIMLALPNSLMNSDHNALAARIAEEFKEEHGVECAVAIHLNKAKTNLHAHIVFSERQLLQEQNVSIAGRNTYFDADGKRSTKGNCVGADGELLPGCSLVKKGEAFPVKKFSGKDNKFAGKGFCVSEKVRFAKMFNELTPDRWIVYHHGTNPHVRLYNLKRGEADGLRAWKEKENIKIKAYNAAIDNLINNGELTVAQALKVKEQFYIARADEREQRQAEREAWKEYYAEKREREYEEWRRFNYSDTGRRRGVFEQMIILGLSVAGVDVLKDKTDVNEDLLVVPRDRIYAKPDPRLQMMVDQLAIAAGRKSPSQLMAERKVKNLALSADRKVSLAELIADAEAIGSEGGSAGRPPPDRIKEPEL